jgi:pimeloyl-ACP methyl ester carboxylesterase
MPARTFGRWAAAIRCRSEGVPQKTEARSDLRPKPFSRGGSMVERFALLHPELVEAVAALSGGAYTVPQTCVAQNGLVEPPPLSLGTANLQALVGYPLDAVALRRIPFWRSEGAHDIQADQIAVGL